MRNLYSYCGYATLLTENEAFAIVNKFYPETDRDDRSWCYDLQGVHLDGLAIEYLDEDFEGKTFIPFAKEGQPNVNDESIDLGNDDLFVVFADNYHLGSGMGQTMDDILKGQKSKLGKYLPDLDFEKRTGFLMYAYED